MPVGAGSIRRAAKKAVELEEKKPKAAKAEDVAVKAEAVAAAKKASTKKAAPKKTAAKKTVAEKVIAAEETSENAQKPEVVASVLGGTDPQVMDMVLSMRDGTPIHNTSEQLGKNQRVEVLQEMPVYLL